MDPYSIYSGLSARDKKMNPLLILSLRERYVLLFPRLYSVYGYVSLPSLNSVYRYESLINSVITYSTRQDYSIYVYTCIWTYIYWVNQAVNCSASLTYTLTPLVITKSRVCGFIWLNTGTRPKNWQSWREFL